ncbi:unnamed protein product [Candida verbasci]|uniref:Chromatin modification-related protein n=1 Tax=Candida verbasci TaxID=1227364 RepID=A0A9W4TUE8_9ASCO|nr:unnamed protein product [Candida verbasci]
MDVASTLEKYTQDLSNLPLEVQHLLQEIKNKDAELVEARKRYMSKDHQLFKFIRQNGTMTKNPKESQLYSKIEEDMNLVDNLQQEKILLANSTLFLITKNLYNLEKDIKVLENEDLIPPDTGEIEIMKEEYNSSSYTPSPGFVNELIQPPATVQKKVRKRNLKSPPVMDSGSLMLNEKPDEDNNLYCFCQRVSFGEMIGCDNENCKYEWFHWSCVGITSPPKDDEVWYCPDCSTKFKKQKKR